MSLKLKTKQMTTGTTTNLRTENEDIKVVHSFCLLGLMINN